jgi:hypothetical protein
LKRHHWVSIGLAAGLVLAITPLVVLISPWTTLLGRTVQNFGHIPLFGVITTLLLVFGAHWFKTRLGPRAQYAGALGIALILGVVTEWVQMIGPRDADLWDLARDGVGAALALIWWGSFDRRFDGTAIRRAGSRAVFRSVSVLILLFSLAPLVGVMNAYRERADRFPMLYSFDTSSQTRFVKTRLSWYEFVPAPDAWNNESPQRVAHVSFSPLKGGALIFNEPYPDWTGHTALVFELFNPAPRTIEVGLRVDDGVRSLLHGDRFNRHLFLEPGFNRQRIAMEEIVAGPTERELDISLIARIIVYAVDPVGGYEIYLGAVLLEPVTSSTSPG